MVTASGPIKKSACRVWKLAEIDSAYENACMHFE